MGSLWYTGFMRDTKSIGDIGESAILADLVKKGHKVLIPFGESLPFDLVAYINGQFVRIQVKTVNGNGKVIPVRLRTISNSKVSKTYSAEDTDYIAVYDITTDTCLYVPSIVFEKYTCEMRIGLEIDHVNNIDKFRMIG